jgi:phosphonate transport system substrate-binding protein
MSRMRTAANLVFALLLALLATASTASAQDQTVVVAMVPEQNVFLQVKRFRPLQDYLSASTGVNYRFTVMSSYEDAFMALENGKAQAAILGSSAALLAMERKSGEILGRPLWKNGTSTYRALIIARKDAGIRSIADLKGKRYAFVNQLSSAGWVFDNWMISQQGFPSAGMFLGNYIMAGSHDVVIEAVLRGHVDAGGCKDLVWDRKRLEFSDLTEKVVVVARSQPLPDSSLVVSRDMPVPQRAMLKDRIFAMHARHDGQQALEEMGIEKFIPGEKNDFTYLRRLFRDLGVDLKSHPGLPPPPP